MQTKFILPCLLSTLFFLNSFSPSAQNRKTIETTTDILMFITPVAGFAGSLAIVLLPAAVSIWAIFLMALGEPLPKQVFGHPWLLMGGGKMSKSKGNVVYADDLVDYFGVDAVRYYVLHEMPFENDGNLTWELVAERTNSDLANTLGNLVNRTISMSNKYFGGVVENRNVQLTENDAAVDANLKQTVTGTYAKVVAKMEELRVADALTEIFGIFKRCNKYIDETEPWVLAKDEAKADRLATVLYNLVEGIIIGASLLEPYMPETAEKIAKQLNTSLRDFDQLEQFGLYESGNRVTDQPEIRKFRDIESDICYRKFTK